MGSVQKSVKKMTPPSMHPSQNDGWNICSSANFLSNDKEKVSSSQKDQKPKDPGKAKTIFYTHLKENSKGNWILN